GIRDFHVTGVQTCALPIYSRYIDPTWIQGMQSEGYAGARTMVEFVEYLWGWDATVTEAVDDRMWQETFEVYVQDRYDLGMQEFRSEERREGKESREFNTMK